MQWPPLSAPIFLFFSMHIGASEKVLRHGCLREKFSCFSVLAAVVGVVHAVSPPLASARHIAKYDLQYIS